MAVNVLDKLPKMTREELEEVNRRSSVLLSLSTKEGKSSPFAEELWSAVHSQLRILHKGRGAPSLGQRGRSDKERKALQSASKTVESWLASNLGDSWGKASKVQKVSLLNLIAHCVIKATLQEREACSPQSVLSFMADEFELSEAIDKAFPGYLSSGMIWMVAKVVCDS